MLDSFKQASLSAKVLIISGLAILLSFGLCGTAAANATPESLLIYYDVLAVILLLIGVLGAVVGVILAIIENFRNN